jgi:hypothetical protein
MTTLADAIANPASVPINGTVGRQPAATGKSVALSNEDKAALDVLTAAAVSTAPSPVNIDQSTPGTTDAVTVKSPADKITLTPTLDTSIYASGDVLWATANIPAMMRAVDQRAVLMDICVVDKADQKPAFTIYFFQTNVTSGTFNAAPTISDADAANYMGHVSIAAADYKDLGGVSVACAKAINLLLEAVSAGTNVYCFAVLDAGTPTFAVNDLVIKFGVVQS